MQKIFFLFCSRDAFDMPYRVFRGISDLFEGTVMHLD